MINKELVSKDFYQNTTLRFKNELKRSVQRINHGSELEKEVMILEKFCENEFEGFGEKFKNIIQEWMKEEKLQQERIMNDTFKEKDEKIQELEARLNRLLNGSPNARDNLKAYDHQIQNANENIKKIQQEIVVIPEMLTKDQIDDILKDIHEELNEIKDEIKQNTDDVSRNMENVLNQTQYMYKTNIKSLVKHLKWQLNQNLTDMATKYNEKEKNLIKEYEAKEKGLQAMVDQISKMNSDLEKKSQLKSRIHHVFMINPSLRPEKILIRSFDIQQIGDPMLKHNRLQQEYNKFVLFSELYGKTELGVFATTEDLNAVNHYSNTPVPVEPQPYPHFPNIRHEFFANLDQTDWCYYNDPFLTLKKYVMVNQKLIKWLEEMGEMISNKMISSKKITPFSGLLNVDKVVIELTILNEAKQRALTTYNNRMALYRTQKSQYEALVFPTEAFNRLVDQFNEFVNRL